MINDRNKKINQYKELFLSDLSKRIYLGLLLPEHIVGCTENEIRNLESFFDISLPDVYKAFLLTRGHGLALGTFLDISQYAHLYDRNVMT